MEPVLTKYVGEPNGHTLDFYLKHQGYDALKKALKESQSHRFLAVKSVSSAIRFRDGGKSDTPMTMHCWIFKKP
jgi:hypothetical protein